MKSLSPQIAIAISFFAAVFLTPAPAAADYTVTGRFQYQDREFNMNGFTGIITPRPIRFADVLVLSGTTEAARGATKEDGTFSITVSGPPPQTISTVCVAQATITPGLRLEVRDEKDLRPGDYYSVSSAPMPISSGGSVDTGTTLATADTDAGKAFNIWDVSCDALQFLASPQAAGKLPGDVLTILWRYNSTADENSAFLYEFILLRGTAAYDDTVILHEIGHFTRYRYSYSDSPGGMHTLSDSDQDVRLAWDEGLATFLASSVRMYKNYPRPDIYVRTDGVKLAFSYELESLTGSAIAQKTGSNSEYGVMSALWDIVDGPGTSDATPGVDDDPMERPFSEVWRVLTQYIPRVTHPGITMETFWQGWLATNGTSAGLQTVFNTVNGMEFAPDSQEPDDTPANARPVTTLQRPVANGANVVLNELAWAWNAVELYNQGSAEADLTGWSLVFTSPGWKTATAVIPPFRLAPGSFVILSQSAGTNRNSILYFNISTSWINSEIGACALMNGAGKAVDFVRWGGSSEPVPSGTAFRGPDPPPFPAYTRSLGRNFNGQDTDSGSDWSVQDQTFGTYNLSGREQHHTFYPSGDVDLLAFNASAGMSYLVETLNPSGGADTIVEVLSTDGSTVLATNDDAPGSKASRLPWSAPANGKYFVRCRNFSAVPSVAQYGSYDIRIFESASPFVIPSPEIMTVSQPGQGGKFQSLVNAIEAAQSGDTIQILDSGTYVESLSIMGKSLTIMTANGKNPIIAGAFSALNVDSSKRFVLDGTTLLNIGQSGNSLYIRDSNASVRNTVITNTCCNYRQAAGSEVLGSGTTVNFTNCTFSGNQYGIHIFDDVSVRIANSIFWNNSEDDITYDETNIKKLVVRNTLVKEFAGKNGNIAGDPQFIDSANNNFRLKPTSPAIDGGDPSDPDLPDTDADGIPRKLDGRGSGKAIPDMGAYEYLSSTTLSSTAVFPQVAAGGANPAYRTSIAGINIGAVSATVNLTLTKSNADPFPITTLNDPGLLTDAELSYQTAAPVYARNGSSFNFSIPPMGAYRIEAGVLGALNAGYARFLSSIPVNGTALFKTMDGDRILSEAGVGLSKAARGFTVYIDNVNNAFSGYAVANFGASPANLTLLLRDKGGAQKDSATFRLSPGQHIAEFAVQRFKAAEPGFEGSIEFASDQNVAAVALRYDNPASDVFSTIPVLVDEASSTLYFPQVVDGGGYRTNFILVNPSGTGALARLDFFADDGSPLSLPIGGVMRTSYDISITAKGVARLVTDGTLTAPSAGWVRVTSAVAIGGSAIFQTRSGNVIESEAGVAASPFEQHFAAYVASLGPAESGLAICNPYSTGTSITLKLRNSSGEVVAEKALTLPPLGHIARFFTQWFPSGFGEFEGILEVIATGRVSGVALRYDNNEQNVFATLPVAVIP